MLTTGAPGGRGVGVGVSVGFGVSVGVGFGVVGAGIVGATGGKDENGLDEMPLIY
jgi:hypothetical protein